MPKAKLARILVLESEENLLRPWSIRMQNRGYRIERVACPESAFVAASKAQRAHEPFDAFVIDLDCPRPGSCSMGSKELIENLRQFHPDTPFLFFSTLIEWLVDCTRYEEPYALVVRKRDAMNFFAKSLTIYLVHLLVESPRPT
jgi:CheY-like chemotaxis protein